MKNRVLLFSILFLLHSSLNAELLSFSKVYELALENANILKASIYNVAAAKEKVVQEKSRLYPQVNLSAYYKKTKYGYYEKALGQVADQGLINYGVSVKQSVYNAQIYSRINVESSREDLYKTGLELEKKDLAQRVFKAFLDLLKNKNKIALSESYLTYSKSKLDELEKKYEMHLASKMDFLQTKVDYNSARINLKKEKKLLKVNELKLKQIIGLSEYELPTINDGKIYANSIKKMKNSVLYKTELPANLELLQAKQVVMLSENEVENSFDAHYPTVDLDISSSKYSTDDPNIDAPFENVSSIMLRANIPIYSGGSVVSRVREYKLRNRSANEELLDTKKNVQVKYDEYSAIFEASAESVSVYKDALESAVVYVDSIAQGYKHGLKSIVDLNDAKTKENEVKYKYVQNIFEMVDSYIGLLILTNEFENIKVIDNLLH